MGIIDFFKRKIYGERYEMSRKQNHKEYKLFKIISKKRGDYKHFEDKILDKSIFCLIIGRRGSGKTALGMKILELFNKKSQRRTFAVGFSMSKMPSWIKKVNDLEKVTNNSVVLVDEGAIVYSARDSMNDSNKMLGKIMAIARHKNLSLFLITQNSAMIDFNVLRLADCLIMKEPSFLQSKFERKGLAEFYKIITPEFEKVEDKKSHAYVIDDDFQGMINYSLPEFWNNGISKSFSGF